MTREQYAAAMADRARRHQEMREMRQQMARERAAASPPNADYRAAKAALLGLIR